MTGPRARYSAQYRMVTGLCYSTAYVVDGNKVLWQCTHQHRFRRGISGGYYARRCAERYLRRLLRRPNSNLNLIEIQGAPP